MQIDKKIIYIAVGYFTLSIILATIKLVLAFQPSPMIEYNQKSFQMIQDRLDKLDSTFIVEQNLIDDKLDSLNIKEVELFNKLDEYDNNLINSTNKIKRYKNEIIKHNYRDSSSTSIINRLNSK